MAVYAFYNAQQTRPMADGQQQTKLTLISTFVRGTDLPKALPGRLACAHCSLRSLFMAFERTVSRGLADFITLVLAGLFC